MKSLRTLAALALCLAFAAPVRAQDAAAPKPAAGKPAATEAAKKEAKPKAKAVKPVYTAAPSGWYVELRGGFAHPDLTDPNDAIDLMQRFSGEIGAPGPLRNFGRHEALQLEIGRRHGAWSWGLEGDFIAQRVRTLDAGSITAGLSAISFFNAVDVRLTSTWRVPKLLGFEIGATAGVSRAHYSEDFGMDVYADPDLSAQYSGTYDSGVKPVAGPVLGWRRPLFGNNWVTARGTWMWRDYGAFDGTRVENNSAGRWTVDTDLVRIRDGAKADIDASGFEWTVGLSHTFGGKR